MTQSLTNSNCDIKVNVTSKIKAVTQVGRKVEDKKSYIPEIAPQPKAVILSVQSPLNLGYLCLL